MIAAIQLDALAVEVPAYSCGTAAGYRKDSDTSKAAASVVNKTLSTRKTQVYVAVIKAGRRGVTCKELAREMGVGMNAISGRFTSLCDDHALIVRNGDTRDGCAVYVVRA